jgi:hypothetical protein
MTLPIPAPVGDLPGITIPEHGRAVFRSFTVALNDGGDWCAYWRRMAGRSTRSLPSGEPTTCLG